ncbi:MAG: PIN domain nuclease [Gemmatimonadetes bacterium]|nr:PIN domain nuclease [Gemmatimonadota bacterium]MCY3676329.1 PIN domain nuclease [Gemmatimonadota bacterium]MYA44652.1 PIN domain nuclease [Gemmatimonadota bacterium]MYE94168.1 PIN domain nuclease [Gemmatimonadota bacterium]MYJ09517.1 PIN domain nuclease [Gemmatimonadota bacterium]
MPCLIDKSALARMSYPQVRARLVPILEAGEAATCAVIDLEVLYSTRNASDHARTRRRRSLAYRRVELTEAMFQRAIEVQGLLALRGHHRVPIPDLIIAAAAEHAGMVLLHYDADFDRIAAVTGQSMEWVVPKGSV